MKKPRLILREQPLAGGQPAAFGVGLLIALIVGILLLYGAGHERSSRFISRMFNVVEAQMLSKTLNRAVPLGLAGLATIAGSMGLWNIGAEGQIMAGAIAAAWVTSGELTGSDINFGNALGWSSRGWRISSWPCAS